MPMLPENATTAQQLDLSATRKEDRITYVTELVFESSQGVILSGHTTDVSLSGAFLFTGSRPEEIHEGDAGVVVATVRGQNERMFEMSFPCKVARVTDRGVGLNFDEHEENDGSVEEH